MTTPAPLASAKLRTTTPGHVADQAQGRVLIACPGAAQHSQAVARLVEPLQCRHDRLHGRQYAVRAGR